MSSALVNCQAFNQHRGTKIPAQRAGIQDVDHLVVNQDGEINRRIVPVEIRELDRVAGKPPMSQDARGMSVMVIGSLKSTPIR